MPGPLDARLQAFYELRAGEEPASDPEARLRFRKAVRLAAVEPGARVLDLGAKWGGLADALDVEIEYTGFDVSAANVEAARARGLNIVLGDVGEPLPFADGSFDRIFCLELLEHLTAPVTLLQEIRRMLADGGRAVVSVPSPYSWVEVARELLGLPDTEGHLTAVTTPVMKNLAALAGLRVSRRAGTSVRIPKTSLLFPTDSLLARSRVYVLEPAGDDGVVFAGRRLSWD